jgi:hypothetical protein
MGFPVIGTWGDISHRHLLPSFLGVGSDVLPNGTGGLGITNHPVVESGLPFEFGIPISADLFGAHRFVPPDDGPQRMGAQPEFICGPVIQCFRRFVSPRRIYMGTVRGIFARIRRGIPRDADQPVDVVGHHDPRVQPYVRADLRRSLPFAGHNAPRREQSDDAILHLPEKRAPPFGTDRHEMPRRTPVLLNCPGEWCRIGSRRSVPSVLVVSQRGRTPQ